MNKNNYQDKGKEMAELSRKIQELKIRIHNIHAAIGKEYYDVEKDPHGKFVKMFADLEETAKQMETFETRINYLNGIVVCTNCKTSNPIEASFCSGCGLRLPHTFEPANDGSKRCSKCGNILKEGQKFCGICGTKVGEPSVNMEEKPVEESVQDPEAEVAAEVEVEKSSDAAFVYASMEALKCPNCSILIDKPDAVFCPECGTKLK